MRTGSYFVYQIDTKGVTIMYKSESEAINAYNQMLDEFAPEWQTPAGSASHNMQESDPTMYRCGFIDWLDSEIREGNAPAEAEDWSV